MSGSKELIALRNAVGELSAKMRSETSDGQIDIGAAIARLREQYASELATANDRLIDGALAKLFHDVGRRKGALSRPEDEPDLFSLFRLPVMLNVGRLKLKRTAKLTLSEAKRKIEINKRRESSSVEENSRLQELVSILEPFCLNEGDTLEVAARRKTEADGGKLL